MKMFRITLIALLAMSLHVMGVSGNSNIPVNELTTEWQLGQEIDGVMIYFKRVECHDVNNGIFKENILVKMVNTTERALRLEWDMEFWYDGECRTCDPAVDTEYHYVVNLKAGDVVEGTCAVDSSRELKYYIRFLNYPHVAKLSDYQLANLRVSPN